MENKVTIDAFCVGLGKFLYEDLCVSATQVSNKFLLGALSVLGPKLAKGYLSNPMLVTTGIVDSDGKVDLGLMEESVVAGLEASGGLPIGAGGFGVKVTADDAKRFFAGLSGS